MKLAFKYKMWGYFERDVKITLKIGTLEDMKNDLGIEFFEIGDMIKKDVAKLMTNLLYFGYITSCKESFKKPKYTKDNALFWYDHLSEQSRKELITEITVLFGEMTKMGTKKKADQKVN
jgi:hypothetical protein